MKARIFFICLAILTAAGCSGQSKASDNQASCTTCYHVIEYKGHPLHCITYGRGIDCDFVRYHKENPNVSR